MSNSNQSAKSGNMVSGEGTVENVVDLLLAQSTGEVSPLYEDNTINNQPAASGNFFNAEGEVENIVDVLLEKTSSEPLYEDKNNTLNTQPIKTGNMVASDGKVYNIVDLLKNAGGGGSGKIETFYGFYNVNTTDGVNFSTNVELYDGTEYTANFEFVENQDGSYNLVGKDVLSNGVVIGRASIYAYAEVTASNSIATTNHIPVGKLTRTATANENEYIYSFDFGENTGSFMTYCLTPSDLSTMVFEWAYVLSNTESEEIGSCYTQWKIELAPPAPVQKGSFDSTTQQLTLNYDYLVEKINSSTVTTAEQKSAMIALLNNQSPVINMATDKAVENSYIYGFMATSEIPVGLQVDKATPCTLKIIFDGESMGGLGSFEAIANYMTELSGETTTPEMVEAWFGSFIVDDNLCTVSGTLGNFSVEFN